MAVTDTDQSWDTINRTETPNGNSISHRHWGLDRHTTLREARGAPCIGAKTQETKEKRLKEQKPQEMKERSN